MNSLLQPGYTEYFLKKQIMSKLIAVVDDEPDIVELVSVHLEKNRFEVAQFYDGKSFLDFLKIDKPDLVVLDLMLPDSDGFEICKSMRSDEEYAKIPVIMLTAKGDETDRILGLELGADDYVTKPFSPKELVARVKAVLRRPFQKDEDKKLSIDGVITIDLKKFEVYIHEKRIDLTSTEFRILQLFTSRRGWVFSRDKILDYLWGNDKIVIDRTVDVHIKNLRTKLGKYKGYIRNVRGLGYKLDDEKVDIQ